MSAQAYRLEVDYVYNCRAKRGERKEKGTGRLIQSLIYFGATMPEVKAEARAVYKAASEMNPGYAEVIAVRGYNNAEFTNWVKNGGDMPAPFDIAPAAITH